jgi:hypothetical protein
MKCKIFMVFLFSALLSLAGCSDSGDEGGGGGEAKKLTVVSSPFGARYYSLSTGQRVDASDAWDIAFYTKPLSRMCAVWTNGGDSGPGSGGVTFTDKTDFSAVRLADALNSPDAEYLPYLQDVKKWVTGMEGVVETNMNVMTYAGYNGGTGSSDLDPFLFFPPGDLSTYMPFLCNRKQFYRMVGMPPTYTPTNQVYILTHHDGIQKSKLQFTRFNRVTITDSFELDFLYQNL